MIKSKVVFKTPKDANYFFGYYDKLQLSKDSSKLLALKVDFIDRVPNKNDKAIIGYFDLDNDEKFIEVSTTRSFNWQQGCMLQWLGSDFNNSIIFNDYLDDQFVSVRIDIEFDKKTIYKYPIYSMHPNGKIAITIDFERHHWCRRGYSYDGNFNSNKDKKIVEGDAIWLVDLEQNSSKKIILLQNIINNKPLSNMRNATHYLEHLMFNPSGNRFCFLHRWKIADGGIYARLYSSNLDGTDVYLLNDSGRMSHFGWQDDKHLLAYGGIENKINKLRKYRNILKYVIKPLLPLYHKIVNDNSKLSKAITGDSYLMFVDKTNEVKRVASSISSEDGHPSFSRNGNKNFFVTDTYPDPDEGSIADLIIFDLGKDKEYILTELNSIPEYDNSPIRCDLHPRWSMDGAYISVDTMNDGVRGCYLYRIIND
jgi:Tol biopolymer transport system component